MPAPSCAPITVPMIMLSRPASARRAMSFCRRRCACVEAVFFFFFGSSAGLESLLEAPSLLAFAVVSAAGGVAVESLAAGGESEGAGVDAGAGVALEVSLLAGSAGAPGAGVGPVWLAHARLAQSIATRSSFGALVVGLRIVRGLCRNSTSAVRNLPHGEDRRRETLA